MTLPLVAICTPVYNGAKFLAETMEAVQAQTYPNLVHCVLDNASTDATPDIIERYKNRRVPIITARNDTLLPLAANWNTCLELVPAEAKWFRMLCADDLMVPEATEKMVTVGESDQAIGVVGSNHRFGDEVQDLGWPKDRSFMDGKEGAAACLRGQMGFFAIQAIYHTRFIKENAPFNDTRIHMHDMKSALGAMVKSKLGFAHEVLGFTRVHDGAVSATEFGKRRIYFAEWMMLLYEFGPQCLGEDFKRVEQMYRRYYFRKLLKWKLKEPMTGMRKSHFDKLSLARAAPTLAEYADAVLDLPLAKMGLRPSWSGWPR